MMAFQELGVQPPFTDTLRRYGFEHPTPVQERALPAIFAGKDVVVSAETGSGKTAAFLLPLLARLHATPGRGHTRALVLVPTRELALQVHTVATELAEGTRVTCVPVHGGVSMGEQTRALRLGFDVVAATPGRLLDHAGRGSTRFAHLEVLVLDEADRMLDMGFLPDIRRILALLPASRQTLLFSATIPKEIANLTREVLRDPERIRVGHERRSSVPIGITHAVFPVPSHRKAALLTVLLRRGDMRSTVVFTRTKRRADRLARVLAREGFEAGILHGDRSQGQRERALESFRAGRLRLLVATDLAARGLDVEGITHVVNFDFPGAPEDYIHRVGRTARADARGDAFALVSPEEISSIAAVEREMGVTIPRVTLPEFDYAAPPPPSGGGAPRGPGGPRGRRPAPTGGRGSGSTSGPSGPGRRRGGSSSPAGKGSGSRDEFWKRARQRRRAR